MDKYKIKDLWDRFGGGGFMILCGAVLVIFPDSAVALVTKLAAWILLAAGIYNIVKIVMGSGSTGPTWVWTALYLVVGGYMLSHPLLIADLVGRFLGLFLVIQGVGDLRRSVHRSAKLLGGVTTLAGIVLFLMPRTLTDTLLAIAGIVLIVVGVINIVGRLNRKPWLESGDSDIIDADE